MQKDDASNNTVVNSTEINQSFSIIIHHSTPMYAHHTFIVDVISFNLGVKVTDREEQVKLRDLGNN